MNILVVLFFLHNVLATAYLGSKFYSNKDKILKSFGTALLLNCIAFAIWSYAVVTRPDNIQTYVTVGVIFFIGALLFFLNTGTQNLKPKLRQYVLVGGLLIALFLFIIRTFIYPADPYFSSEGFFFFNIQPIAQMIYIFALLISLIVAVTAVASRFRGYYGNLLRFCFLIEVAGGIALITTKDAQVLYLTGWIMGIAYSALWAPLLFSKNAWLFKK